MVADIKHTRAAVRRAELNGIARLLDWRGTMNRPVTLETPAQAPAVAIRAELRTLRETFRSSLQGAVTEPGD